MMRPAARISAVLAFLGSGCHRVGVPAYAHTVPSRCLTPLLEELSSRLGPHFDPVSTWQGRHELLPSAHPDQWKQEWWTDALGKASTLALLESVPPRDQARILEQSSGVGTA